MRTARSRVLTSPLPSPRRTIRGTCRLARARGRSTVSDAVVTVFITRPSGAFIGDLTADPATGNASELVSVTLSARSNATAGGYEVSVTADPTGERAPP